MNYVSQRVRVTFLSAILVGIITHMYAILHLCPQEDVFSCHFGYGAGYSSGRWGLAFLGDLVNKLFGNYPLPWLNGIWTILFLAVSSVILVETLDLAVKINWILVSMFMVVCPAITSTFLHMYTAPYYGFSIMLMCYGTYLVIKKRRGWIPGILILTVSMGIYQAYLGIAATMFLLFLILDCLKSDTDTKSIFIKAWKYLGILCGSVLLYMGAVRLSLRWQGGALTEYQAINTMGEIRIQQILGFIVKAWLEFLSPAVVDRNGLSMFLSVRISYLLLLLIMAFMAVKLIMAARKEGKGKAPLLCLLLFLFPCSINIIYFMCPNGYVHTLMRHAQIMIYITVIVISEKSGQLVAAEPVLMRLKKLIGCICLVTVWSYCILANQAYFSMDHTFSQAKAYYNVVVAQIKSLEGYRDDMPVALVGMVNDRTFTVIPEYEKFRTLRGMDTVPDYLNIYSREQLIKYYCGFDPQFVYDTSGIREMKEFKNMPCYPNHGSIAILDGTVIVKFGEEDFYR